MLHLKLLLSISFIIACCVGGYARAQIPDGTFFIVQKANQYLAADLLLKAKIHDSKGNIFGDVEDLILNENNQVEGVIIGIGGFLGVGEKRIGVQYKALQFTNKNGKTVLSLPLATKELLQTIPEYQRAKPPKSFLESVTERAKELSSKTAESTKDAYDKMKTAVQSGTAYEQAKEAAANVFK
ncbi:MAG: PRC-barrel domain-containing protein [Hyphomicrobiaceae bacterium]|nr:PRC-barrel domain-containing protein [Hyphomicrobiaceae bacterium]